MKPKVFLLIVTMMALSISVQSAIWTVDNKPGSPAQFKDLQAAIDTPLVAQGDTLYVSGSPKTYGDIVLNKTLTLIGAGYNPNNDKHLKSALKRIKLDYIIETGYPEDDTVGSPIGSNIMGFYIRNGDYNTGIESQSGIKNILVEKNHIKGSGVGSLNINGSSWIIKNNIITNNISISSDVTNILIINNIITGDIDNNCYSLTIKNNIFFKRAIDKYGSVNNSLISNNIFLGPTSGANNCTFRNNLSFGSDDYTFDYGTNTAHNNIVNQDPLFVDITMPIEWNWDYDYHLQETSPGKNAGSDGTDIGIYGGSNPFPTAEEEFYSGMPDIPQIIEMNISHIDVAKDDTLEVNIKARVQE